MLSHSPTFFTELDALIKNLPTHYQKSSSLDEQQTNLFDFYQVNFVKQELADHQALWRSQIGQYQIAEYYWQAKEASNKTIIFCHGYFDHAGLFGKLIEWGLSQGYNIHGFDLPGHGLSSGAPAAIDSFDDYRHILTHILRRSQYSHYSLIGQSTGCAVIANYLLHQRGSNNLPQQVHLLAPLVSIHYWQYLQWLYFLIRPLNKSLTRDFVRCSHDENFNQFLAKQDPLQARKIPMNWLGAMHHWLEWVKRTSLSYPNEIHIIQGTEDKTVDWQFNMPLLQKCFPKSNIHLINGAFHNLVNESDQYWQQVVDLLSQHHE